MKTTISFIAAVLLIAISGSCAQSDSNDKTAETLAMLLIAQQLNSSDDGYSSEPTEVSGTLELWDQGETSTTTLDDTPVNCEGTINDPEFTNQWHLQNTLTDFGFGDPSGNDVNVTPVWSDGNCGDDAEIAVVDDGMDINHEDLTDNVVTGASYNYTDGTTDPSADDASHGTSASGLAAARSNSLGGRGTSPGGNLRSYNLLQSDTQSNEADAMTRSKADVWISSNSWGPQDTTGMYFGSSSTWVDAVEDGLKNGRDGKGTVYTWAAGNGAYNIIGSDYYIADDSNYDGYANFFGVIAVCAVDTMGERAYYSENGANLWVCAPSGSFSNYPAITTTDITGTNGYNTTNYTSTFSGTSAATPIVSGTVGLILQENPELTWRDVKLILAESARKTDTDSSGPYPGKVACDTWTTNGAGYNISHTYGFGVVDADAAVELAKTWTNLADLYTYTTDTLKVNASIPDNSSTGLSSTMIISSSGLSKIEYVAVNVSYTHTYNGDLNFVLKSPDGTESILSETHGCWDSNGNIAYCNSESSDQVWRFGTARNLGESVDGNWTLSVKDGASEDTGKLVSWSLVVYGTK